MNQQNDEIDLLKLINGLSQKFLNVIWNIYTTIKYRWIFLLVFIFIGIGIGILYSNLSKPVYKTSMTVVSGHLNNQFCNDRLKKLMRIKKDGTDSLFCSMLKIDKKTSLNVIEINYEPYGQGLKEPKDTLAMGYPFKINLAVYDPSIIDTMEAAIINYLENNEYAIKRKLLRINRLNSMKVKLAKTATELDSLKGIIAASLLPQKGSGMELIVGDRIDPVNIYKEEFDMHLQQLQTDIDLTLSDNINAVEGFAEITKPSSVSSLGAAVYGGLISFFAGFIFALFSKRNNQKH